MKETSGLAAFLNQKCPKCRSGNIFTYPLYNYFRFHRMNKSCTKCGLKYELEPGFFFASMYISYAINVGLMLVSGAALVLSIEDAPILVYVVVPPAIMLFFLPFTFRFSRVAIIYFFSGYQYDPLILEKDKPQ